MKKLSKIKLNQLSKADLEKRAMHALKGGINEITKAGDCGSCNKASSYSRWYWGRL